MQSFEEDLAVFIRLYNAGFRIHDNTTNREGYEGFYRFSWKSLVFDNMADIDVFTDKDGVSHYNTMFRGKVEPLK